MLTKEENTMLNKTITPVQSVSSPHTKTITPVQPSRLIPPKRLNVAAFCGFVQADAVSLLAHLQRHRDGKIDLAVKFDFLAFLAAADCVFHLRTPSYFG